MPKLKNLMQCPNLDCQAQWGIEEWSFQECDSCGYPDPWEDEDDTDSWEDEDYEEDDYEWE